MPNDNLIKYRIWDDWIENNIVYFIIEIIFKHHTELKFIWRELKDVNKKL